MKRRPVAIRKADLSPAFEAAKAAGYDQVSVVVEIGDGKRFLITAGAAGDGTKPDMAPFDKWRAGRDTI